MASFIRVLNWEDFQHYKDRSAPWIKLHRDILTSHFWVVGDDASKLLAICIMLLAQRTDNKIPHDLKYIKRFSQIEAEVDLQPLVDAHFIEIIEEIDCKQDASKPLASCSPEREGERDIHIGENASNPEPKKRASKPKATTLPEDFKVSERVERWAKEKGFSSLDVHLESFISRAKAKGYTYVDWDEAFMSAVRDNWAKVQVAPKRARGEFEGML
jgi:hypothetical protein